MGKKAITEDNIKPFNKVSFKPLSFESNLRQVHGVTKPSLYMQYIHKDENQVEALPVSNDSKFD